MIIYETTTEVHYYMGSEGNERLVTHTVRGFGTTERKSFDACVCVDNIPDWVLKDSKGLPIDAYSSKVPAKKLIFHTEQHEVRE